MVKMKMAGAVDTKVGRSIAHGRISACNDPGVKRSKAKVNVKLFFIVHIVSMM